MPGGLGFLETSLQSLLGKLNYAVMILSVIVAITRALPIGRTWGRGRNSIAPKPGLVSIAVIDAASGAGGTPA
jgi:hypothetical protein